MPSDRFTARSEWRRRFIIVALVAATIQAPARVFAQAPEAGATIEQPSQIMAIPAARREHEFPLRLEGRVNFFDPGFKLFWIERDGQSEYVQLSDHPPRLVGGQYVVIEGTIVPRDGLDGRRVSVSVLRERDPVDPLDPSGSLEEFARYQSRVVALEGYVDSQIEVDATHQRFTFVVGGRPAVCWVILPSDAKVPDWTGRTVRMTGLYSARFDPTRTRTRIEIWVNTPDDVIILADGDERTGFTLPATPIEELPRLPVGTRVRVSGRVVTHDVEGRMVVYDKTGRVTARTLVNQRMLPGAVVDVVGRVESVAGSWELTGAVHRAGSGPEEQEDGLHTVASVRNLTIAEAAKGLPVEITGMSTWSLPVESFFFLQDATGGVRVHYDPERTGDIRYGKLFRVRGKTRAGRFAPEVTLEDYADLGSLIHPVPPPIGFDQAITGREDGQWVQMLGYLREMRQEGDWHWLYLTTPGGPVTGHLQSPVPIAASPGALLRVRGVCEIEDRGPGRIGEVKLRIPFNHDVEIEEEAPADLFETPRQALAALARLSESRALTRVRVQGTVLHAREGQLCYLEEGETGVLALGASTPPLAPGERVEAVGILGREGSRPILRESVFRRVEGGSTVRPALLAAPARLEPTLDSRLVKVRAGVIDVARRAEKTVLSLQSRRDGAIFEVLLEEGIGLPEGLAERAEVEVTGLYRLMVDASGQYYGFQVQPRSVEDLAITRSSPLWTLQRALTAAGVLAGIGALAITWILSLRRRVARQTEVIRSQLERHAQMEVEVQRAARLEALGALAASIAHNYNNALTGITGNVSVFRMEHRVSEEQARLLDEMDRSAQRARVLTQQLMTFARGGDPARSAQPFPDVVRAAVDGATAGSAISVEWTVAPDLLNGLVDRNQMIQAISGVATRAVQVLGGKGRLAVEMANADPDAIPAILPAGKYLRFAIHDDGPAIDERVLPLIFDPYAWMSGGTGSLALATAFSIVRKHGGHIWDDSVAGAGTTFTFWLPAAERDPNGKPARVARPTDSRPIVAEGTPRVLVMDDDEAVRNICAKVVRWVGAEPLLASEGGEALRLFDEAKAANRPVSLVILDLTIHEGMGGRDTIGEIRRRDKEVPAIVSSGYSDDPVMSNHREHGFDAVVAKPFKADELAATIKRFLAP